jgi:hypothetical protein
MFDFRSLFDAVKRHPGAFVVILFVVVVFFSAPFLLLWRAAVKRIPALGNVPGAAK